MSYKNKIGLEGYCLFDFLEGFKKGRWTVLLLLVFFFSLRSGKGQEVSSVYVQLQEIASLQKKDSSFFYKGSFPSYRLYGAGTKLKKDNNIFFTGLIAFTLKKLSPFLKKQEQTLADSIIARAQKYFPYFKASDGQPIYGFWQTNPPLIFPHSWFLTKFNKSMAMPFDLDDTSILWLSQNPEDSILLLVKKLMAQHANGQTNWIENTFPEFRKKPAYSTWFGKKMPIDFDFCVLCNVLYFVFYYHLPLNRHDSASISLVRQMITEDYYQSAPAYISPHYGRTPILLYHISRLLDAFSIPALDSLRPRLLKAAYSQYHHADNWLDSTILSTTVLRLGGKSLPVHLPIKTRLFSTEKTFFVAGLTSRFNDFWKRLFLSSEWVKYYFLCPVYRRTLYLENQIIKERK